MHHITLPTRPDESGCEYLQELARTNRPEGLEDLFNVRRIHIPRDRTDVNPSICRCRRFDTTSSLETRPRPSYWWHTYSSQRVCIKANIAASRRKKRYAYIIRTHSNLNFLCVGCMRVCACVYVCLCACVCMAIIVCVCLYLCVSVRVNLCVWLCV